MTQSSTPSAEGDEPLKSGFKLVLKNDPDTVYETDQHEFMLGRSEQCEIVIKDPHISRVQARIRFESNRYCIENLGQNPTFVKGIPATDQLLKNGDEINMGTTNLWFQAAQDTLKRLLTMDLTPAGDRKGKELLSQTVLAIVQQMAEADKMPKAKQYLIAHLRDQNLAQQLQEADRHFRTKRYLTPVNNNAYSNNGNWAIKVVNGNSPVRTAYNWWGNENFNLDTMIIGPVEIHPILKRPAAFQMVE
jgi:pSer/pThr/pTyr-binding forkhead associated (FHA) protein